MKRWLAWAAVLLAVVTFCPALAGSDDAETCWTTLTEDYYHFDEACGGEDLQRYPLSVEAAKAFDKLPCPVCAVQETEPEAPPDLTDIAATQRGGTWVFRIPEAALHSIALDAPLDEALDNPLAAMLGGTVADAMAVRVAVPIGDALCMNLRSIEGECCLVLRPEKAYSDARPLSLRVEALATDMFGASAPVVTGVSAPVDYIPEVEKNDYAQVFSQDYGKKDMTVYRAIDSNIAVIHLTGGPDSLLGVLQIGELEPGIPVQGYKAGKQSVFCCVLTDAELGALVAGGEPAFLAEEASVEEAGPEESEPGEPEPEPAVTLPDLSDDVLDGSFDPEDSGNE